MKPIHTHDCKCCTFLGNYQETTDLYFCKQGSGDYPTVIARHSGHGPDYTSGLMFAAHVPALAEAKARAQTAGLLPK